MINLGQIYREESNTTVIYFNKTIITIKELLHSKWQVSTAESKILTSNGDLVKIKIQVFPNGANQIYENYVSIKVSLLSSKKMCYYSTLKFSILSSEKKIKNEISVSHHWTDSDEAPSLLRFISHQETTDILENDNLNIVAEVFCMQASEQKAEQLELSSTTNIVEMTYVWTICNLLSFRKIAAVPLHSTEFPSNADLVQFSLGILPLESDFGYAIFYNCVSHNDRPSISLLINETFSLKSFGNNAKLKTYKPYSHLYDYKSRNWSWGVNNFLLFHKLSGQCIVLEYHGIYAVDTKMH